MKEFKIKKNLLKMVYILLVFLGLAAAMLVLTRTAQNGRRTREVLPKIVEEPVYVECLEGEPLEVTLRAREDFRAGGFQLLLVNISGESRGTLRIAVTDSAMNLLLNQVIPVETIAPGKWFLVEADISFVKGEIYQISILADGSEPYFMQVPEGGGEELPFEETVARGGEAVGCGVSLGVSLVEERAVTYGEILYYSVPFCILTALVLTAGILFGFRNIWDNVKKIPFMAFCRRFGSDLFLVLLFGAICVSIYSRAYLRGVYISSDSAGYLREEVNLAAGNGFGYDKLAGYESWFANWPILYPAMIALVMAATGANAYLASKLLAMLIAGIILALLRLCFKKDAWMYALCLTNIGFLNLAYYTWSEIPFILFLLGFGLVLAKILGERDPERKWYFLLGALGLCCFLTRYFGIYVWIVTGVYILCLLACLPACLSARPFAGPLICLQGHCSGKGKYDQANPADRKALLKKTVRLTVTAFLSGLLSLAYLLVNKVMNGMASGVSRAMWWDDYEKLTNDLIESLLTEVCNVFSIQIPELVEEFPYHLKVFVLVVVFIGLLLFVRKNCRHFTRESVMITMAVIYCAVFIVIRYFSSMDTFYFRFFEPASFLLCVGLIGLLMPRLRGKEGFRFFAGAVTAVIMIAVWAVFDSGGMKSENGYYDQLARQWEDSYREIPEKSVIIFNDIDFRSSYYRPDVVEGTISPADTPEEIRERYYGSEYLCIRREFAEAMLAAGEYEQNVAGWLKQEMEEQSKQGEFLVIPLEK